MKYFYDPKYDGIRAFESDGSQDHLITTDMRELSQVEINNHLNPSPSYQSELASLNRAYQADVESLKQAFSLAYLADGPSQDAKQSAIRAQYEARKTLHAANVSALKAQYGAGV